MGINRSEIYIYIYVYILATFRNMYLAYGLIHKTMNQYV